MTTEEKMILGMKLLKEGCSDRIFKKHASCVTCPFYFNCSLAVSEPRDIDTWVINKGGTKDEV